MAKIRISLFKIKLKHLRKYKSKYIESLLNELNNFKSDSKKGNDQIDDSIAALQVIKKDVDDCNDKIDTVINNLMDYNDGCRKYMYTENK